MCEGGMYVCMAAHEKKIELMNILKYQQRKGI